MDSAPDILNLFVEPTGEMIYFLAVIAISQASLFMALGQRLRGEEEVAAGRYTLLLTFTMLSWLAMGVGGLVALITDTADEAILPPLERAVNMLVITFVGAALLTADRRDKDRTVWRVVGALALITIAAYAYTAARWIDLVDRHDFNEHVLGYVWTFVPGLMLVLAIGLLFSRYKDTADIPLKLIFFVVLLLGYTYTIARMSTDDLDGHTSGALRLGFLVAMPIVTVVIYRLVLERLTMAIDEVAQYAEAVSRPQRAVRTTEPLTPPEPVRERPRRSALSQPPGAESMALLRAIGIMLERQEPDQIPRQIAIAIATVLKADVVVLASYEDDNWADVLAAYDLIQERLIPGLALNLEEQPTLVGALENREQRALVPDRNVEELVDLYTRLDIAQLGPAYIQPLMRSGEIIGVAIVGMPYTNRDLSEHETTLVEGLAPVAARLLALSRSALTLPGESEGRAIQAIVSEAGEDKLDKQAVLAVRQEMQASLELAQEQISELSRMVRDLQVELDYERSRLALLLEDGDQAMSITQRIEVLAQERHELSSEREALARALQEAQATLVSATADEDQDVYSTMFEGLRRERDELQVQKSKLERQLQEIRTARQAAVPGALGEMLEELGADKARLAAERDVLQTELDNVQSQLRGLGIEGGPLAVAKALGQLTEERTYYKQQAEKIAKERDLLIAERRRLEDQLAREAERETKISSLEADLRRLATDREALTSQRDSMRAERDELLKAREQWYDQRTRLIAEATVLHGEMEDVLYDLNKSKAATQYLNSQLHALEAERDRLVAESGALKTERDQLLARAEGDRERLAQLGADGVGALQEMITSLTEERESLENELDQVRRELERLDYQPQPVPSSSMQQVHAVVPDNADVILSIAQELRTPMSSIMGYTDLLLSESGGILGALQRQFVQRVQANNDRLAHLINDLVQITQLDAEGFKLEPVTVDMMGVIEDSITAAGNQFREKDITLHMNLADALPSLRVDPDAMQQVMMQLLSNAYLASPVMGEVIVEARYAPNFVPPATGAAHEQRDPADVILVSITDQGGGVPPEDQRRVFGRLYRADNPLIEGLGDTGVGLSIAKALVEAHDGAIWLESTPGKGSTFHFILPLAPDHAALEEAS